MNSRLSAGEEHACDTDVHDFAVSAYVSLKSMTVRPCNFPFPISSKTCSSLVYCVEPDI